MLETVASWITAVYILMLIPIAMTKNEVLMALYLMLFTVSMICWLIAWYAKRKKNEKPSVKTDAAKPVYKPVVKPEITLRDEPSGDYCVVAPDPQGKREYTLSFYRKDGSLTRTEKLTADQRVFVFSGLALYLKTKGWPRWVLEGLYRKNFLADFCSDQGEMPMAGRVYWECRNDLIYFEKKNGQWSVHSEKERFSAELPGATDEQIVRCLRMSPGVLFAHQKDFADFVAGKEPFKPLLDIKTDEGRLTVEPEADSQAYLISHAGTKGHSSHRMRIPAGQYTRSGLLFILQTRKWPAWTIRELRQWQKAPQAFTRDEAAPDREGCVYWQNEGDLSRFYNCLYFERPAGESWRLCCFSNAPRMKEQYFSLPEAVDEDIVHYLSLPPREAFWSHPHIRERIKDEWARSHQSRPYKDSEALEEVMNRRLFKKLDPQLQAMGMDRETFIKKIPTYGAVRFAYSIDHGYRLIATPDRGPQVNVICRAEDEDTFCAQLVELANGIRQRQAERDEMLRLRAERNKLAGYVMNDREKKICLGMEKKLDDLLAAMGAGREFIQARQSDRGDACFGYAEGQGYYYMVRPERSGTVVPFLIREESGFLAQMLREAAEYQDTHPRDAVRLILKHAWGGRMEHGEQRLVLLRKNGNLLLNLFSWNWSDAAEESKLMGVTCRCVGRLNPGDCVGWRPSGYLFYQKVAGKLPFWAAEELMKEETFTSLFLPGTQEEKTGQVYLFNGGEEGQDHWIAWFEKRESKWWAHVDVSRPDLRMNKTMPLPEAKDWDIADLLLTDISVFLNNPRIDQWYRQDPKAEVTLYERVDKPTSDGSVGVRYAVDSRCGTLYCYTTDTSRGQTHTGRRRADYKELARQDVCFEGIGVSNWADYQPDRLDRKQRIRSYTEKKEGLLKALKEAEDTFSEEERKRFEARRYQYSQDTGRDGREPEVAAANRGLVFVDGTPVAREVAERMEELAAKKKPALGKPVELYRHDRQSFHDEEARVLMDRKSPEAYTVMVHWDTPNMNDHTVYDLPLTLTDRGCTRGQILTWLKEQRCVINFSREALEDGTKVIPGPRALMRASLPAESFGKPVKVFRDKFYQGSASHHKVSLHRNHGIDWLLLTACWRDEHDACQDRFAELAVRDEAGSFRQRSDESVLKWADRREPKIDHALLFKEVRIYHEEIDLSAYGEAEKELYRWHSSVGHDSQSWNQRLHTQTLHRVKDDRYVIDRLLFIDGTTQENRWITTVAKLLPDCDTEKAERIRDAIGKLPCRTPD